MKKIFLTLCLILTTQIGFAQSADSLFSKFRNVANAQYVDVSKPMLDLFVSKAATEAKSEDDKNNVELLKKIDGVKVLSLEDCDKQAKDGLLSAMKSFASKDYEKIFSAKENEDKVSILAKINGDIATEVVLMVMEDDGPALIKVTGKISKADVSKLVNDDSINIVGK